jgi:hypothetical protein
VQVCGDIKRGLELAGMIAAHVQSKYCSLGMTAVTALSPAHALESLPCTLPALVQHAAWQATIGPVVSRLRQLSLREIDSWRGVELLSPEANARIARIAANCLVGMRSVIPRMYFDILGHVLVAA